MTQQELFWKYAEGKCSPAERAEVEKILAPDPVLRWELQFIQQAQTALKSMEGEQPSPYFVQNVMNALPQNWYPQIPPSHR